MNIYEKTSYGISRQITQSYSTSFSLATRMFRREIRQAIYSIYGFVRLADEVVDSFHGYDKKYLIEKFEKDYNDAFEKNISTNPALHSFQLTVKKYGIEDAHIRAFLKSMKSDLEKEQYTSREEMEEYIYGSADVVGLMCLKVFCHNNDELYTELEIPAMKLGSAFQKVNFLRDLKNDTGQLGRQYFPVLVQHKLDDELKLLLIEEIENDFRIAYQGIKRLPGRSRLAVLIAYYYYRRLLTKIKHASAAEIMSKRIRVSNPRKLALLFKASLAYKFNLL